MAQQARVTSLDQLEYFRTSLIIFMGKANRALDQVADEVKRTRYWLQNEQRTVWETQVKRRQKLLDQANQELISARFSEFKDSLAVQQMAVRKAKAAVQEAEEKLLKVKTWSRNFDHEADPRVRKLESLRHFLEVDMPKAIAYLSQTQRTLEDYTERSAPADTPPPITDIDLPPP
ncbi:MAG: hypothetical protein JWO08_3892 [Verrucomicrobiaceae bacterium]|nr:hypothetical protein [Verrucomicrobiaceae bacterium]